MELKKYRLGDIVNFNKGTISKQDDYLEETNKPHTLHIRQR